MGLKDRLNQPGMSLLSPGDLHFFPGVKVVNHLLTDMDGF